MLPHAQERHAFIHSATSMRNHQSESFRLLITAVTHHRLHRDTCIAPAMYETLMSCELILLLRWRMLAARTKHHYLSMRADLLLGQRMWTMDRT